MAKAITAFQNALKIAPLHVGSSYGLAEVYLRTKQLDKVRQVYAKILDNQPGHLRTLMRQIGLEAKEGRKERINILIARAIKTNPTAIEPRILAAQELINLKKPIKAIASVKEFLSQNPNNIGLLNIVGQAQIAAKKSGAAVVTLERLVRNAPNSPGAHFLLAEAYSLIGNTDAVLLELKMALALQPKFLRAGVAQIRALAISGKEKQAVKELRALKSEFPDNSDITALEGWLASKMGQFAKAVRILKARMAKNPTEELAINLSTALWNGNQKLKSIRILKNWVHDHENSISARMELANNYALTNRPNDAIDTWRLVIARAPNQWLALNNLAANLTPSKPDEALGYAEQAYKIAPLVPQVAASLSEILMLNGIENTDRVIKILQPISRTFPKHFYAQLLIAKAQIQLGNQIIAKKILKRIIAQNPNENVRASIEEILEALKN